MLERCVLITWTLDFGKLSGCWILVVGTLEFGYLDVGFFWWMLHFGCVGNGFWLCGRWILIAWTLDFGCLDGCWISVV